MFIVHVVRQFVPSVGGLEDVVRELSARQVGAGMAVRVVTLDRLFHANDGCNATTLPSYETINGVEIVRIPYRGSHRYPIAPRVLRYIRGADIVHVHGIDFFFDFFAITKLFHRRRLVVSTHGGFFHTRYASTLKRIWFQTITSLSMRAYAGVAAVSHADVERFRRIRPAGLSCIENGVNIHKFGDAASVHPSKTLICLGRLSTNKRLDRLIAWLAELRRVDPAWSLIIAGRPWDLTVQDVLLLARRAGQQDAVSVLDSPTDEQLRSAMARCSVIVSASEYEGFGLAAVEGLSAGLYPVLSDIAAFRSLVGTTGVGQLLDFDNAAGAAKLFVDGWEAVSRDYGNTRRKCIDASLTYDWSAVAARYLSLYRSVLGQSTRSIMDVAIKTTNKRGAFMLLERSLRRGGREMVAFGNAHLLNVARTDSVVRAALRRFLVFNDGIGADIASRFLFGARFPDNLNGTDFVPYFLAQLQPAKTIFLFGAKPGVAERAATAIARISPQHTVVGVHHGYCDVDSPEVLHQIRSHNADLLLVALGNPRQELWLARHFDATGCSLGIAVGALLDFLAGEVSRAPRWVRAARLEWVYRLGLEPRRLAKRYVMGIPSFLGNVIALWWSGVRGDATPGYGEPTLPSRTNISGQN
ncbi:MAG: WecB/TagA/CpsF family glycosyltransferase [Alphaproteobacteria bacterium]|nr:WecB/TagA/CpsF family glycosyltransferase [Alphaproteobacteria bacterium]